MECSPGWSPGLPGRNPGIPVIVIERALEEGDGTCGGRLDYSMLNKDTPAAQYDQSALAAVAGREWLFALGRVAENWVRALRVTLLLPVVVWLPLACGLAFVLHAQNDWMPRYRLLVPIIPFLSVMLGHAVGALYQWARRSPMRVLIWCLAVGGDEKSETK